MPDISWSPAAKWFWELLKVRLENKVLQREIADLKAQLAKRDADET